MASEPDYLARIDRHLDRQDELMAEIREEMRLSREERAAQTERAEDVRVFARDLVTRVDRALERNDRTLQRLDRTLDGVVHELREVREQGNALTEAVLALLDRLNGAGGSAPAT